MKKTLVYILNLLSGLIVIISFFYAIGFVVLAIIQFFRWLGRPKKVKPPKSVFIKTSSKSWSELHGGVNL